MKLEKLKSGKYCGMDIEELALKICEEMENDNAEDEVMEQPQARHIGY